MEGGMQHMDWTLNSLCEINSVYLESQITNTASHAKPALRASADLVQVK
jgi:hypothetical protein